MIMDSLSNSISSNISNVVNNCQQISSNGSSRIMSSNNTNSLSSNSNILNSLTGANNNISGPQQQANQNSNDIRHHYTFAGIVQFLQYEWQRFELHRQQWEVEKAELQARIALLQGERKGQENIKNDLIRRIKMLEYCLKQERAKYHKLKYGVDPENESPDDSKDINFELDDNVNNDSQNFNWKQGRQLLRHYLQEIGYTDTIIDVRSNRVRSLLGLTNLDEEVNKGEREDSQLQDEANVKKIICKYMDTKRKKDPINPNNVMINDAESSVLATFEFLNNQNDHESMLENLDVEEDDAIEPPLESIGHDETEVVLKEFDIMLNNRIDFTDQNMTWQSNDVKRNYFLGELASLTDTDNVIDGCNSSSNNNSSSEMRKTWNQRYILKSHYDCIRSLRFHATEPLLITASDDETLKLWNMNKTQAVKNKQTMNPLNATLDLEPIYTYRGHSSRVLSLCINGNIFYSGSQNGEIISWSIPSNVMNIDIYDAYDYNLQLNTIDKAHNDCVWSLASMTSPSSNSNILCSASSDRTIKIWDTTQPSRSICLKSIESEDKVPTDISIRGSVGVSSEVSSSSALICSYNDGTMALYDIEAHIGGTAKPVLSFEKSLDSGSIYSIAFHPIMPIVITAHQHRLIKLWDINSGRCIHSMVAHLDQVTSVDCDPNGWYILSGSHDCSVRLWNFDNKNCVQEITSHRKKFDEAILDVTFHPSKPFFASAGADGLAKIFV